MRFSIGKFFAWILVGLLLLGLLGFGITDVLVGRNNNTVAKVGNYKISSQEFIRSFQNDLRFYSTQLRNDISIEEAKSLGIPQLTLGKLINSKILESEMTKIGLSRGDSAVKASILKDSNFQDLSGKFNKDIYNSAISRAGLKLDEYENLIRNQLSSSILLSLSNTNPMRNELVTDLLAKYKLEKRSGFTFSLDLSNTKDSYSFTENEQNEFFKNNKESFREPETSLISYSILNVNDLSDEIDIPENEIATFYKDNVSKIFREAAYNVDRLIFKSESKALDSLKNMSIGLKTFYEIGNEKGLTPNDLNLGFLEFRRKSSEDFEN